MSEIYFFVVYKACGGDDFIKKFQILEFFFHFYFITFNFFMLLLLHKP